MRSGTRVGAVESHYGCLLRERLYGTEGKCLAANAIIAAEQNLANLDADMRDYMPFIIEHSKESIRLSFENPRPRIRSLHFLLYATHAYGPSSVPPGVGLSLRGVNGGTGVSPVYFGMTGKMPAPPAIL
jgi:hypothetical protein